MISDNEFRSAAALLKRHAPPNVWENFVGAFSAYTARMMTETVGAPLEGVVLAQGFARMSQKYHQMLTECEPAPPRGTQ